ncbi:MAG: single-stranded DNA-binding protein [candidate division WOR-3 bacterium]
MPNINFVILSGRLVADAERRVSNNGKGYLKMRIAVDQSFKSGDTWKNDTLFINVLYSIRDSLRMDEVLKRLLKGVPVVVEGKLRYREWETEGKRYQDYFINAYRVQILEKKVGQQIEGEFSDLDEEEGLPPEDIPF